MKHIFKNFNILGLVAFIAAGMMAISWTEVNSKLAPQWYQVVSDPSDPTNENLQEIIGLYPGGEPTVTCVEATGDLCALQIDMKDHNEPITTVAEARELAEDDEVEIGDSKFKL